MFGLTLLFYAIAVGYTFSAIAANLYRISGATTDTDGGRTLRLVVMVVAGPSVFFELIIPRFLKKEWSAVAFWLASAGIAYWSLAIGLLTLEIVLALQPPL